MTTDEFETRLAPLWSRAQAGEQAAYRAALALMAARLRGYFGRRMASSPEDVEDLVQETLLAIHIRRGSHDPSLPVANWMFAIARYKAVDLWRRRERQGGEHLAFEEHDPDTVIEEVDEHVARTDLTMLLGRLPAAQRTAIQLLKIEGLTAAEAATRSGVSASNLKVRAHRGLKALAALVRSKP